jgi:hypothetical protein
VKWTDFDLDAATVNVYEHALPSAQQDAARRLGAVLYGKGFEPMDSQ